MIINFVVYNTEGKITKVGFVEEQDISLQLSEGENYIIGSANPSLEYVENNQIIPLPVKPNGEYVFNYTTKQWEFDKVIAEQKALIKRDRLLAEGPDRISPLWWNSMTPQQQQEWEYYRQALLDITGQADYPEFIVWPIKP